MSNDHQEEEEWFSFTKEAIITPVITGGISCLCSLIIIITIIRSKQNSSPYHRILAFMSSWDVVVSIAIALVTIPMPQTLEEGYNYKGPHYGNKYTCAAQSFIILTGIFYIQSSSMLLNIYYLCVIRFNIPDFLFLKYAQPIYFVVSSLMSLPFMIFLLVKDELNPTPFEPFCGIGIYPDPCVTNEEIECTVSDNFGNYGSLSATFEKFMIYYLVGCIGLQTIALMISMGTIICTIYQYSTDNEDDTDGDGKYSDASSTTSEEDPQPRLLLSRGQMKMVAAQAFAYIMALSLTYIFTLLSLFDSSSKILAQLKMMFLPSQGLFNLLIFACHKIHHYKRTVANIGNWDAIQLFFSRPDLFNDRYIVTNLDFVDTNVEVDNPNQQRLDGVESKNEHELYEELDSKYALSLSSNEALSYGNCSGDTLPKDVSPLQSRAYSGVVFRKTLHSNEQQDEKVGKLGKLYTLKEDVDDN